VDQPSDAALCNQVACLLRLEERLETSLRQQEETRSHAPEIGSQLGLIRGNALRHIRQLGGLLQVTGSLNPAEPESVEPEDGDPIQRDLREDFGLISVIAGGCLMLLTAARALDEPDLAELAEQHLRDHTEAAVRILGVIPLAVVQSLREEGAAIREEAVHSVSRTVAEIWRSQVEPLAAM
jgi:hypothetical protein